VTVQKVLVQQGQVVVPGQQVPSPSHSELRVD
jgi:hypothetical protein